MRKEGKSGRGVRNSGQMRQIKRNCHAMIDAMWGDDKTSAYIWLSEHLGGKIIHFSQVKDPDELFEAQRILGARMRRKGLTPFPEEPTN